MQRNSEKCRGGEYSPPRLHQTLLFVNCLLPGYRIRCYAWDHLVWKEMSAISNCSGAPQICVGLLLYGFKFSFPINVLKICDHRPSLECWGSGNLESWPMAWDMAGKLSDFTLFLFFRTEMKSRRGRILSIIYKDAKIQMSFRYELEMSTEYVILYAAAVFNSQSRHGVPKVSYLRKRN